MVWKPLRLPEDREPRPVGASLADVSRRFGLAAPAVLGAIFTDWEVVVGATLARHVRPVGLRNGVLMLDVDEPGWATELRFLHDDVIRRIVEVAGPGTVTELSIRVRTMRPNRRGGAQNDEQTPSE